MRKINNFKNDALKAEHVQKTFKNLNSFKTMLKMLKTMQIYQEHIFFRFSFFFAIFVFFSKTLGNDTTKELMSSPKCRSVEVINNSIRPGSNHREVNCINYK
jgi:hypothetical protein